MKEQIGYDLNEYLTEDEIIFKRKCLSKPKNKREIEKKSAIKKGIDEYFNGGSVDLFLSEVSESLKKTK